MTFIPDLYLSILARQKAQGNEDQLISLLRKLGMLDYLADRCLGHLNACIQRTDPKAAKHGKLLCCTEDLIKLMSQNDASQTGHFRNWAD